MKNQKGISLIALIITIIVIIILAAIVIVRAMGTVDSANKAKFDSEFSDFRDEVVKKGLDLYAKIITAGYTTDPADYFYMAAQNKSVTQMYDTEHSLFKHVTEADNKVEGVDISNDTEKSSDNIVEINEFDTVVYNNKDYAFPVTALKNAGAHDVNGDEVIYCYRIDSTALDGYKAANKPNFHGKIGTNDGGDSAASPDTTESHWVTEDGTVFTYPGYFYDGGLYITNTVYSTGTAHTTTNP